MHKMKFRCTFRNHMVGSIIWSAEYKRFICRGCASIIHKDPEIIKKDTNKSIREILREKTPKERRIT